MIYPDGSRTPRSLASWALVVTLVVALAGLAWAQTPQDVARTGFASTVTVLLFDEAGNAVGLGSGFAVGANEIVTNAHVVTGAHTALVRPIGQGEPLAVTTVDHYDPDGDLAVLSVPGLNLPALSINASDAPVVGDAVFAVGSPLGLEGTFTQGIVSGYQSIEDVTLIQITAPISPGSSGGPVLNLQGDVVGVAVGTFANGQNLNFAIPVTTLANLLGQPEDSRPVHELGGGSSRPRAPAGGSALVYAVDFGGIALSYGGVFSFSARNNLPRQIENVHVAVSFFDADDFPLSTEYLALRGPVPAGLAVRGEFRLDSGVQELITARYDPTDIVTRVEFRVLAFEYAD